MLSITQSSAMLMLYQINDMVDIFELKNGKFKKNEDTVNIRKSI
jgi:hypothetical protein